MLQKTSIERNILVEKGGKVAPYLLCLHCLILFGVIFNCGVCLRAGGVSQGKFPCLSNVFYSGRTVSSWATSATRGTRPRPGRCTRCSGWGSSSAWTTTPPTCRILWMISMIPTEELIIDTIRNALLFNKLLLCTVSFIFGLRLRVLTGTFDKLRCLVYQHPILVSADDLKLQTVQCGIPASTQ